MRNDQTLNTTLALMRRGEEYAFSNLTIPLPLHVRPRAPDYDVLIVSHPAWSRLGFYPDVDYFLMEQLTAKKEKMGSNADKIHGGFHNIIKSAYLHLFQEGALDVLSNELRSEVAVHIAKESQTPVIITVPAVPDEIDPQKFVAIDNASNTAIAYYEYLHKMFGPIYALPTAPTNGQITLGNSPNQQNIKRSIERLVSSDWSQINVAGGQIDGCLSDMVYSFSKARTVVVHPRLCYAAKEQISTTPAQRAELDKHLRSYEDNGDITELKHAITILCSDEDERFENIMGELGHLVGNFFARDNTPEKKVQLYHYTFSFADYQEKVARDGIKHLQNEPLD